MVNYYLRKSLRLLDTVLTGIKYFFSFYPRKKSILHIKIKCNSIFDRNILSRGYPTKLKNYGYSRGCGRNMTSTPWNGNSKRVGGLKQKCPRGGGRGGGYFLDYTIVKLFYYFIDFKLKESHKFISSNYNCQVLPSLN